MPGQSRRLKTNTIPSHLLIEGFKSVNPGWKINLNYKMKYPGPEFYTGMGKKCPLSPCMSDYWRSIPIRQGSKRQDPEHDEKPEEEEESENSIRAEYAEEIRTILKISQE